MRKRMGLLDIFLTAANSFSGITAGLDPRGFLLVDTGSGIRTVLSGGVRAATGAKL